MHIQHIQYIQMRTSYKAALDQVYEDSLLQNVKLFLSICAYTVHALSPFKTDGIKFPHKGTAL
jgi:hypothetical protein